MNVRTCTLPLYCFPAGYTGNFIQLYENKVLTLQQFKQVKQFHVPLHLVVHSAYVQCDLDRRSDTNSSETFLLTQNMFLRGWSPSPLLSPSTLSPSHVQLIQHTASACDNTHTVVPPRKKNKPPLTEALF